MSATPTPYLLRRTPLGLVLGAFVVLTLPLTAVILWSPPTTAGIVSLLYLWVFGYTHFVITFTMYMRGEDLRFYASSPRRKLVYFAIPVVLLVGFALYGTFGVAGRFVALGLVVELVVRFFNYFHLTRQAFGVLQILKGSGGLKLSDVHRSVENLALTLMAVLAFDTYVRGGVFDAGSPVALPLVGVIALLLVGLVIGYTKGFANARHGAWAAPVYFGLQMAAMGLAVWRSELYVASLAVHYVEYHVLMAPRMFRAHEASVPDRWLGSLTSSRLGFYALVLLAAVVPLVLIPAGQRASSGDLRSFALHAADGLFVFHYFVEAFLWKMKEPHYRKTLGPLYFPASA